MASGDSLRLGALTLSFQSYVQPVLAEPITHVSTPIPPTAPYFPPPASTLACSPVYAAPVPPQPRGDAPWALIAGVGGVFLLLLLAIALSLAVFWPRGSAAPAVEITSPSNGAQVTVGQETAILAMASDPRGVARVELWANGQLADSMLNPSGSSGAFPVQFQWTAGEQGSHILEVRAYSRDGRSSEPASVSVRAAPGAAPTPSAAVALVEPTPTGAAALTQDLAHADRRPGSRGLFFRRRPDVMASRRPKQ